MELEPAKNINRDLMKIARLQARVLIAKEQLPEPEQIEQDRSPLERFDRLLSRIEFFLAVDQKSSVLSEPEIEMEATRTPATKKTPRLAPKDSLGPAFELST